MDPDRYTRRVMPVSVTGMGPSNTTSSNSTLNCFEDMRWDFDYTSLLRLSRFGVVVELGGTYKITYPGTPPQQQQFSMSGNAPEEGIVIKIKYAASAPSKHLPWSVCMDIYTLTVQHGYLLGLHCRADFIHDPYEMQVSGTSWMGQLVSRSANNNTLGLV